MATSEEKAKLVEILAFTPRTYKISMWGYGGEKVMGTVERKVYDYFKHRRLDLMDLAWDSSYADENNIPDEFTPFPSGSWYECDNMGHAGGVSRNAGTLQIEDENGETIFEKSLDDIDGCSDDSPEWACGEEVWIDSQPAGTVVFIGNSNEKGTFFEGTLDLTMPFDITKLTLQYDEIDGEEIINTVFYNGEQIDNWGGSTDGKSSDFGMYIAGSQKATGKWEKYSNMDDIEYEMTEWFPKKINPVREGVYMIRTAGKNSYTYQAKWTGARWISSWHDDTPENESIKIKEWQGLANDPDEVDEMLTRWPFIEEAPVAPVMTDEEVTEAIAELDNALVELEKEMGMTKTWTIRTHYKKSCEQHEYFYNREIPGAKIIVKDGYRSCEYTVETNDGKFPEFEFTFVPGGDGKKDSLDLNSLYGTNIENSELVEMFDGGCWGDIDIEGIEDEDEADRLRELIEEEGSYAIEDEGDWYLDETEVWVWGPLEVEDEDGNVRIIIADEDGNVVDFEEE